MTALTAGVSERSVECAESLFAVKRYRSPKTPITETPEQRRCTVQYHGSKLGISVVFGRYRQCESLRMCVSTVV